MFLALQLRLGLYAPGIRRPDDPRPSIGQLPVDFGRAGRGFWVLVAPCGATLVPVRDLVETWNATLTLQATHAIDDDECHQRQP